VDVVVRALRGASAHGSSLLKLRAVSTTASAKDGGVPEASMLSLAVS